MTVSSNLKAIEGREFTLRAQRNCQDSVRITNEAILLKCLCSIEARIPGTIWETVLSLLLDELAKTLESSIKETRPDNDAIKAAMAQNETVPVQLRRARNKMMLLDILSTLFLTHVGNLTTVKSNQRRFAPTPAHIERNYLPTSPEYARGLKSDR